MENIEKRVENVERRVENIERQVENVETYLVEVQSFNQEIRKLVRIILEKLSPEVELRTPDTPAFGQSMLSSHGRGSREGGLVLGDRTANQR